MFRVSCLLLVCGFFYACATVPVVTLSNEQQAYTDKVLMISLDFDVPKTESEDAWGRGISWLSQYGTHKIQSSTDYSVVTFSPSVGTTSIGSNGFGYSITRSPIGNSMRFSVRCDSGWSNWIGKESMAPKFIKNHMKDAKLNSHILADYIKTGELPFPDLITR